jgi:hypothetical protein
LRDPSSTQPEPEGLSQAYLAALGRLQVDAVVVEVAGELERVEVPCILLKGRSIADWLYDRSEPRAYGDADLLVRSSDRPCAEAALERLGFAADRDPSWIEGWSNPAQPWLRAGDGSLVDLHVSLAGACVQPDTLWRVLSGETEPMRMAGAEVRVLTPPARAVHLALHVTQHEGERGQALRDLQLAVEQLDHEIWVMAAELANRLEAVPAFGLGLRMVLDGDALADRLGLLRSEQTRSALEMSRLRQSLRAVKDAPTVGARANMLLRKLVPSPRFMRHWSSLAQRGFGGLALAYLWRPFWLLGRTASAIAGGLSGRHRLPRDSSSPR